MKRKFLSYNPSVSEVEEPETDLVDKNEKHITDGVIVPLPTELVNYRSKNFFAAGFLFVGSILHGTPCALPEHSIRGKLQDRSAGSIHHDRQLRSISL